MAFHRKQHVQMNQRNSMQYSSSPVVPPGRGSVKCCYAACHSGCAFLARSWTDSVGHFRLLFVVQDHAEKMTEVFVVEFALGCRPSIPAAFPPWGARAPK